MRHLALSITGCWCEGLAKLSGMLESKSTPKSGPIFIMGTGRSGTSLVRAILNAHPELYLSFEASFFSFAPKPNTPAYRQGEAWLERYQKSLAYAWLRLEPDQLKPQLPDQPSVPDVMSAIMRAKAQQHGRHMFGDKTPTHLLYLPQLWHAFPNAKLIHVVRDPRAVVASLCRMPWALTGVLLNSLFVRQSLARVPVQHPNIFELRLESLLRDPEAQLRELLDFLGLPWSERVLEHPTYSPDDTPPFPWLRSAQRPIIVPDEAAAPSWQILLTPAELRLTESLLAGAMKRYSYRSVSTPLPFGELSKVILKGSSYLPYTVVKGVGVARVLRSAVPPKLPQLIDTFLTLNQTARLESSEKERVLEWLEG